MGRIAAPYGVRGWVKVAPWSQDRATLIEHRAWWIRRPGTEAWVEIEVLFARAHGGALVAELGGVRSREDAARMRGSDVALPRSALVLPAANEYYWCDLEGMEVVNRAGVRLGRVAGLSESGAHPLLHVVSGNTANERLIPFVAAYIDRVDAQERRIDVDWQEDY